MAKVQGGGWEVKHLWSEMEVAGEKTVRKRLTRKGNVCIPLMETCLSWSLFKSMLSFEKLWETQRDVGMYSREEGIC